MTMSGLATYKFKVYYISNLWSCKGSLDYGFHSVYIKGLHGLGFLGLVCFLFVSIFKLAFLNVSVCVGSHLSLSTTNLCSITIKSTKEDASSLYTLPEHDHKQ